MRKAKAIALISGGLDSTLALALMQRLGAEIKAVNFYTGLCITETQRRKGGRPDGTVPQNEALRAAADREVDIEYVDVSGRAYLDMLVHPRYGYGHSVPDVSRVRSGAGMSTSVIAARLSPRREGGNRRERSGPGGTSSLRGGGCGGTLRAP